MSFKKLVLIFNTLRNSLNFVTLGVIMTFLVSSSFYLECQCQEHEYPYKVQALAGETTTKTPTSEYLNSEYQPHSNYYSPVNDYSDAITNTHDNTSYQTNFYHPNPQIYTDSSNYNPDPNENYYYTATTTTPAPHTSYDGQQYFNQQSINSFNDTDTQTNKNSDQNSNNNYNYYSDENLGRDAAQNNHNYNDYSNDMTMNQDQEEPLHTFKRIRIIRPPNGFQKMKMEKAYPYRTQIKERRRSESLWAPLNYSPDDPDSRTIGETLMQTAMFPVTFFAFSMIFMDIMHRLVPIPGLPNIFGFGGFGASPTTTTTPAPQITKYEFKPPQFPDLLGGLKAKILGFKGKGSKKGFLDSSEESYSYKRRRGLPLGKRNRKKKKKKSKKGSQFSLKRFQKLYKEYLPSNAMG